MRPTTIDRPRTVRLVAVLILLVGCGPTRAWCGEQLPIQDVPGLWAGYDPRAEPLDVQITKSWDEGAVHFESLYFTGETWEGKKIRVFAYRGIPKGNEADRLPGVLHIHGGGQTASLDWVRFWTRRGYACVSHDFCGKMPNRAVETVTDWGTTPGFMMADPAAAHSSLHPTPKNNAWYHWILVARRALTLLETSPRVDAKRLGIFGISVGGTLTWMVAGTDERVRAAVPIYGVGQNSYVFPWQKPEDPVDPDTRLQRATIESESYAPFVTCPLLFMNASNDHHGRLDLAMRTLDVTTKARMLREVYTPRYVHHIDPAEGRDLPLWMDLHLKGIGIAWPASPTLRIIGGDANPRVTVTVDRPAEVEGVEVHYGLSNPWPVSRFYRSAPAKSATAGGAEYSAAAPILAADDTIYAFANIAYRGGVRLSTRLLRVSAKDLPGVHPTLPHSTALIDAMTTPAAWFWWRAPTDPIDDAEMFQPWTGPNGERGFTHGPPNVYSFATVMLGDAQFRSDGTQPLLIDIWADSLPKSLDVELAVKFFQPGQTTYRSHPKLDKPAGRWLTVRLSPHDFTDDKGVAMQSWKDVDFLWLSGTPAPGQRVVFAHLRWDAPSAQP